MYKNYFKSLMAVAMMAMAGLTLTSCDEVLNEIFDNPVEVTVTPSETSEDEVTVTLTANGASISVNAPSDITDLLNQVKSNIAAKGSAEYVVEVTSEGIEATSGDNTISIPKVAGSDINLQFDKAISTETALTVKAAETESTTPTDAVDKLTITMPAGSTGLDLNLDMPETTVTLKAASGTVVYDEIVAVTASNTLIIESGVTVKNLQLKGGTVLVKDGGKIETFVLAPDHEGYEIYDSKLNDGQLNGKSIWNQVLDENGDQYKFDNVKIAKGSVEEVALYVSGTTNILKKLIIAEGVSVLFQNNTPAVEAIEGEGDGSGKIMFTSVWGPYGDDNYYENEGYLSYVQSIKNITFEEYSNEYYSPIKYSYLYRVPADAEDVTFRIGNIRFDTPKTSTATVKNCKFESPSSNRSVVINAPAQSDEITSFKFTFDGCEFNKDCKIRTYAPGSQPKLDEEGNEVTQDIYCWWRVEGESYYWYSSASLDDVPEANQTVGQTDRSSIWNEETQTWEYSKGYWIEERVVYDAVEYKDYYVTVALNGCKYDGNALTSESDFISDYASYVGIIYRYEIDGTTYRALWDSENKRYILIPA